MDKITLSQCFLKCVINLLMHMKGNSYGHFTSPHTSLLPTQLRAPQFTGLPSATRTRLHNVGCVPTRELFFHT